MKKSRGDRGGRQKENKSTSEDSKAANSDARSLGIDDEDYGFGGWLRSPEGVETLRLFVIGNSIVVFTTVAWPSMQAAYGIVHDWLSGEDSMDSLTDYIF